MVTPGTSSPPLATPLIKNHVTVIPAKTLALSVVIGQGANCEMLHAWLKFFYFPADL